MLYIVLAYLMLFAALTNAVCVHSASFLPLISTNAFYFHALSLFISCFVFVYFIFLICIMHSAFNLFVFPNYMFTSLLFFFFCVLCFFFFKHFFYRYFFYRYFL